MRFKKVTEKSVMSGVITPEDLKKKFKIPENALITVTVGEQEVDLTKINVVFEKTK